MKYQVILPSPKAKRMAARTKQLTIEFSGGFDGYLYKKTHLLQADEFTFDFDIASGIDYLYDTSTSDGDYFNVYVDYANESSSRTERIYLVPMKKGP